MDNPIKPVPQTDAHHQLRGHLLVLYAKVIETNIPAGNFLGGYFRQHKEIKGGARGFLAATLFSLLRFRPKLLLLNSFAAVEAPGGVDSLSDCARGLSPQKETVLALARWLYQDLKCDISTSAEIVGEALKIAQSTDHWVKSDSEEHFEKDVSGFLERVSTDPDLKNAPELIKSSCSRSVAPELLRRWIKQWGEKEAEALAVSYQDPSPLDLRVNSLKSSAVYLSGILREEGIAYSPCKYSPTGIRLERKVNLKQVKGLEEGTVEVQDEGSQLISVAMGPKSWCQVLDACAGAGGKALHLASMMEGRGRVYAHDSNEKRLEPLPERRRVANATNIMILKTEELDKNAPYDSVLIDAPCLGLGRLRRDPAAAWRDGDLSERLVKITNDQKQCLGQYAPMVKPGGFLLYAVCCLEPEETTELLESHEYLKEYFVPAPLPELFKGDDFKRTLSEDGSQVYLLPSLHGTDGFFIAKYQRKKKPKAEGNKPDITKKLDEN